MIRVYFDWNIFSSLRNSKTETFASISRCLQENKCSILLVYSPAHLQDLKRSYFKSELGKTETEKDLEFLSELTKNHCLGYDPKEKIVHPYIKDPSEYFNEIFIEDQLDDPVDIENIFDKDDPLRKLWSSYWELLNSVPSGINFEDLDKLPVQYQSLKDLFKTTKQNDSFGSLMKDIVFLLQHPNEYEIYFKNIRSVTNKDLKIDPEISNSEDPFNYIDKILLKNNIQKNFFDLTTELIENSKNKTSRFDYFVNYYLQLDMFGFNKDKKISNLIDDATHSFYGAHTDIFVTDDKNTNKKSKALYKQLNIATQVIYSDEFCSTISKLKRSEAEYLSEQIESIIDDSILLLDTLDDASNPSKVFKLEPLFLDFFNRFQFSVYTDSESLIFYKKQGNYSNLIFWTEVQEVVNKLIAHLGPDSFDKSHFMDMDQTEIINEKWSGRFWKFQEYEVVLNYVEQPFGLTLRIEFNKPNR